MGAVNTSCRFRDEQGILLPVEIQLEGAPGIGDWWVGLVLFRFCYKFSWIFLRTSIEVEVKSAWFMLFVIDFIWDIVLGMFYRFRDPCPKQPLH